MSLLHQRNTATNLFCIACNYTNRQNSFIIFKCFGFKKWLTELFIHLLRLTLFISLFLSHSRLHFFAATKYFHNKNRIDLSFRPTLPCWCKMYSTNTRIHISFSSTVNLQAPNERRKITANFAGDVLCLLCRFNGSRYQFETSQSIPAIWIKLIQWRLFACSCYC